MKLVGVHSGAAACSGVWTRGESKGASEIEAWDSCSAQARERARAGPLVWALHGDVAVAAAGEVLGSAGARGEGWGLQREATGGGELAGDAWEPAHGELMAGKAGKALAGGAVGGRRREAEQGGGDGHKDDFAISKSFRDLSVNKQ